MRQVPSIWLLHVTYKKSRQGAGRILCVCMYVGGWVGERTQSVGKNQKYVRVKTWPNHNICCCFSRALIVLFLQYMPGVPGGKGAEAGE